MISKKTRVLVMGISTILMIGMLTGCSAKSTGVSGANDSEIVASEDSVEKEFRLEYTEIMKQQGFTEDIVLESKPERVVCVSTSTTPLLFEVGASLVGIPTSTVFETPSDYTGEKLQSLMSDDFNIETVVALNPDLVIIPSSSKEQYGDALESSNIPVYYTNSGHSATYESVVQEAEVIINAFGKDSENAKKVLQSFDDLDKKMEESKKALEGKTVMIIATTEYIQSKSGTAGSMADMIGLTNVYENEQAGMVPLDQETTLGYNPDVILAIGSSMSEEDNKAVFEAAFAKNSEYWGSLEAIKNNKVIYLPSSYMPSTGIGVVKQISDLIDFVYEKLEINN
ncbi:ABC transporter substrate-binding protein [Paraclostridium bifermentans]|mgnify:FL=1|jgi:iron complex transport system substrate-binding protein|uniref:ABC transporter substrate-binding protein n=1 Tax=Paraclostridium bifermentans TaxID=1490 RepID=UPI00189DE64A|nr:ABC transporter substrate-binding protein [Paraclostridium bifermentans]